MISLSCRQIALKSFTIVNFEWMIKVASKFNDFPTLASKCIYMFVNILFLAVTSLIRDIELTISWYICICVHKGIIAILSFSTNCMLFRCICSTVRLFDDVNKLTYLLNYLWMHFVQVFVKFHIRICEIHHSNIDRHKNLFYTFHIMLYHCNELKFRLNWSKLQLIKQV